MGTSLIISKHAEIPQNPMEFQPPHAARPEDLQVQQLQDTATPSRTNSNVHRGRAPKDPLAQITTLQVSSIQEYETAFRTYLDNPPAAPEHASCEFQFWIGASFVVSYPRENNAKGLVGQPDASANNQPYVTRPSGLPDANTLSKSSLSVLEALAPALDPKDRQKKQRAIARACVEATQRVDGYRYSFHNSWASREDDAYRFSYYCNDSLLNKDRAANQKASTNGKRACKPTYDCKGLISVKFSAIKQSLEVIYKHIPLHKTYAERAPVPRLNSKRREWMEKNEPDRLPKRKDKSPDLNAPPPPPKHPREPDDLNRTKKKRKKDTQAPAHSAEADLRMQSLRSLLELIQTDEQPKPAEDTQPEEPTLTQPRRRRPRKSCDQCRRVKHTCDGVQPVCNVCASKTRACSYADLSADFLPRSDPNRQEHIDFTGPSPPADEAIGASGHIQNEQVSALQAELDLVRKEKEDLKVRLATAEARIQDLETKKALLASTNSHTTPALQRRPTETPPQAVARTNSIHSQGSAQTYNGMPTPIQTPYVPSTAQQYDATTQIPSHQPQQQQQHILQSRQQSQSQPQRPQRQNSQQSQRLQQPQRTYSQTSQQTQNPSQAQHTPQLPSQWPNQTSHMSTQSTQMSAQSNHLSAQANQMQTQTNTAYYGYQPASAVPPSAMQNQTGLYYDPRRGSGGWGR